MTQQNSASLEDVKRKFELATPETKGSIKFDQRIPKRYDDLMQDAITRPELDAKLETIEARMDARISRIEDSNQRIESGMSSLKTTVLVTGVSAVLAVVGANIGLIQTMIASYESGKSTATAITLATEQMKQTQEELKAIRDRLDKQQKQK